MDEDEIALAKHYTEEIYKVTGSKPDIKPFMAALCSYLAQIVYQQTEHKACINEIADHISDMVEQLKRIRASKNA